MLVVVIKILSVKVIFYYNAIKVKPQSFSCRGSIAHFLFLKMQWTRGCLHNLVPFFFM